MDRRQRRRPASGKRARFPWTRTRRGAQRRRVERRAGVREVGRRAGGFGHGGSGKHARMGNPVHETTHWRKADGADEHGGAQGPQAVHP